MLWTVQRPNRSPFRTSPAATPLGRVTLTWAADWPGSRAGNHTRLSGRVAPGFALRLIPAAGSMQIGWLIRGRFWQFWPIRMRGERARRLTFLGGINTCAVVTGTLLDCWLCEYIVSNFLCGTPGWRAGGFAVSSGDTVRFLAWPAWLHGQCECAGILVCFPGCLSQCEPGNL
jgi:hypothetical protein